VIGQPVPGYPWQWLASQWESFPWPQAVIWASHGERLISKFSLHLRIVSYWIYFELSAPWPGLRPQISILHFWGIWSDLPSILANTSESMICASCDINIWSMSRVKDVGIVIFVFVLVTSLEWVWMFVTGEITHEYWGEPASTRWFGRSFLYLFFPTVLKGISNHKHSLIISPKHYW